MLVWRTFAIFIVFLSFCTSMGTFSFSIFTVFLV